MIRWRQSLRPSALGPLALDLALVLLAWWAAFWLRFNLDIPDDYQALAASSSLAAVLGYGAAFLTLGVDRNVWRFTSLAELRQLVAAVAVGALVTTVAVLMLRLPNFPRSVALLHPILVLMLLSGARAAWRSLAERREAPEASAGALLVLGPLQSAAEALRALKGSRQWYPVGIVSPLPAERGKALQGVRVLGTPEELAALARDTGASIALVASPPGSAERRELLLQSDASGLTLLTLPRPDEWLSDRSGAPRRIRLEDLLGRDPVQLDVQALSELFAGQTVLVTGAGGSIGTELCRQIARFGVGRLVCVDMSEYAIYQLEQELREAHPQMEGLYYTANVREPERLRAICAAHPPAVVFHAAAYKHVPLMEQHNEIEALRTNVQGTWNAARIAGECGVRRFVMISTDKAVNPTSVMGASKRLAELVVQAAAGRFAQTEFVSVRFGNVLGSSGSVVPLFTAQVARGGPVTVTHPEMVRYFMTIPEAAQLVLQAGLMGRSGQIFVLDMGEPMRIVELARMIIRLSGHTEQDIPISFTGLRPGEKLYEELLADDETTEPTPHPKLRIAKTAAAALDVEAVVRWIGQAGGSPAPAELRQWLRGWVPEYSGRM